MPIMTAFTLPMVVLVGMNGGIPGGHSAPPGAPPASSQAQAAPDPAGGSVESPAGSVVLQPLPAPALSDNAAPAEFLDLASHAIAAGRIAEAQEAMERAETRALDRSVRPSIA